jgi:sugar phosphate permease
VSLAFDGKERQLLWLVAVAGLVGPNGIFLYFATFRTDVLFEAMRNPVALTFMIDALAAMGLIAYLFAKAQPSRLHWGWFITLSLLGGLVFSIPAFLLLRPSPRETSNAA